MVVSKSWFEFRVEIISPTHLNLRKAWPPKQQKSGLTSTIGQTYTEFFLTDFCRTLRVAVLCYPVEGQVFPKP